MPAPWIDAVKYFTYDNKVDGKATSPQCRLTFYLLGNWKISDIMTEKPLADVLNDAMTNLDGAEKVKVTVDGSEYTIKLVSPSRKARMALILKRLISGVGMTAKLKEKVEDQLWDGNGTLNRKRCNDLKNTGFFLPFNHATKDMREELTTRFDAIKKSIGDMYLRELLTTALADLSPDKIIALHDAKRLGLFSNVHHNSMDYDNDPTIDDPVTDRLSDELEVNFFGGPNGKCCGTNPNDGLPDCVPTNCLYCYCQFVIPGDRTSGFNSMSDPCPN